jgi:hypothetical protein
LLNVYDYSKGREVLAESEFIDKQIPMFIRIGGIAIEDLECVDNVIRVRLKGKSHEILMAFL